ncbi:hypothetical protein QFC22_006129 [Naganishia vaughanmartiniae]|uniref:Uncharacterized protein n=1 Tax=Naganishia vaughanmartiniae TaxID=1424756 RepID=A0ACC2WMS8_9TREE|nr:hypothetical protein QFC22_006129 [Naganishia vaughanmartiniae]
MGKSLRNKKKVAARTQKRTDSFYAVHHAARLQRISSKLQSGGGDAEVKEDEMKVDGEPVKGEDVENKEGDEKAQAVKTEDDGMFPFPCQPPSERQYPPVSRHQSNPLTSPFSTNSRDGLQHTQENLNLWSSVEQEGRMANG